MFSSRERHKDPLRQEVAAESAHQPVGKYPKHLTKYGEWWNGKRCNCRVTMVVGKYSSLNLFFKFLRLAQLLCHFCQVLTSPSTMGLTVEQPKQNQQKLITDHHGHPVVPWSPCSRVGLFLKIRNHESWLLLPVREVRNWESENGSFSIPLLTIPVPIPPNCAKNGQGIGIPIL